LVAQGDKLKPEIMSRPEEGSKPTEETQKEPEHEKQFTRLGGDDRPGGGGAWITR
jgi:hypothetical protein